MTDKTGMDGNYIGGGAIDHAVYNGEIYLNVHQLSRLLWVSGSKMGMAAMAIDDIPSGCAAHMLLTVASKLDDLRSELLKREAEAMFKTEFPPGFLDETPFS